MAPWKWYVYILLCEDKSYYVGMTWNADTRWTQHLSGMGSLYTQQHAPEKVVYLEEYESLSEARIREHQIKGWTRAKKEKLISGEWGRWE
jgi:predicted GIY-YIG superfamily endonuclease